MPPFHPVSVVVMSYGDAQSWQQALFWLLEDGCLRPLRLGSTWNLGYLGYPGESCPYILGVFGKESLGVDMSSCFLLSLQDLLPHEEGFELMMMLWKATLMSLIFILESFVSLTPRGGVPFLSFSASLVWKAKSGGCFSCPAAFGPKRHMSKI